MTPQQLLNKVTILQKRVEENEKLLFELKERLTYLEEKK
jgi:hypothetical protein